jgi:hypothetical protein
LDSHHLPGSSVWLLFNFLLSTWRFQLKRNQIKSEKVSVIFRDHSQGYLGISPSYGMICLLLIIIASSIWTQYSIEQLNGNIKAPFFKKLKNLFFGKFNQIEPAQGVTELAVAPLGVNSQGDDPQEVGPQGVDPQGGDPQGVDPQGVDPQGVDPQGVDPQGVDEDPEEIRRKTWEERLAIILIITATLSLLVVSLLLSDINLELNPMFLLLVTLANNVALGVVLPFIIILRFTNMKIYVVSCLSNWLTNIIYSISNCLYCTL